MEESPSTSTHGSKVTGANQVATNCTMSALSASMFPVQNPGGLVSVPCARMYLKLGTIVVVDVLTSTDVETDSWWSQVRLQNKLRSRRIPQGKTKPKLQSTRQYDIRHHNCCGILCNPRCLRAGAIVMRVASSIHIEGENYMINNLSGDGGGEKRLQQLVFRLLQRWEYTNSHTG